MIFLLNLKGVVLFLLMTHRYMQPVLTPNSVVQKSQPIWMLLQNGQTVNCGMLFSAEKSEHLHIGKATGRRVTMTGVPIPEVKHHRHLGVVMNNKLSWAEHIKDVHGTCSRMIGVLRRLRRRLQGTTFKAIFIGAIRPLHGTSVPSLEWRTNSKPTKTTRFILQETLDSPASTTDSIRLSLSGSALQDEIKCCTTILMHTSSPASFSIYGIFIPKVRVPSSSNKKIINILSSFVPRSIVLWNALPKEIRESNKFTKFKTRLTIQFTYQILFSFSSDKDRRTDSRIRRKNTAQPRRESNSGSCEF